MTTIPRWPDYALLERFQTLVPRREVLYMATMVADERANVLLPVPRGLIPPGGLPTDGVVRDMLDELVVDALLELLLQEQS